MAVYTHDFKLEFDGTILNGQIEFNTDGIVSYQLDEAYNLTLEQMEQIGLLINVWHRLFKTFGDTIKLIRVREKAV